MNDHTPGKTYRIPATTTPAAAPAPPAAPVAPRRLACPCTTPPTLLATIEGQNVNLKIRDRYYHIEGVNGRLRATCPRCGKEHIVPLGPG